MTTFPAVVADKTDEQQITEIRELSESDLPDHEVTVDVEFSTLNYKDGLAMTGSAPICRSFPMVCGIDLAGTVASSSSEEWREGDRVVVNGYGLSESHWGGYTQKARMKPEWLVRIPDSLSTRDAMTIGTAGYTAMLCVMALDGHGVEPGDGPVLVTGAAGGVGSVAVALLAEAGFQVTASTGREETHGYLEELGATGFLAREDLSQKPRPIGKELWAGVVDAVGSNTLANAIAQTKYGGCVAACGLAGGFDLPASVYPFILRSVVLAGVDSVMAPMAKREEAWRRLGSELSLEKLRAMETVVPMSEIIPLGAEILAGKTRGRVVVDVNG